LETRVAPAQNSRITKVLVKEGERVKAIFAVTRKAVPTAKSGKTYLAATLVDRTGEIEARSFDRVDEFSALFEEKDLVEVEGAIGSFQGKPRACSARQAVRTAGWACTSCR
jgi:DNA polymerase III alpha subunit